MWLRGEFWAIGDDPDTLHTPGSYDHEDGALQTASPEDGYEARCLSGTRIPVGLDCKRHFLRPNLDTSSLLLVRSRLCQPDVDEGL